MNPNDLIPENLRHTKVTPPQMPRQSSVFNSSKLVRIIFILFILAIVFWAGMIAGYHKAEFSYRFSENYIDAFGKHHGGFGGAMGIPDSDDLASGHGAAGRIVSKTLPTILVSDRDGTEKNIILTNETVIRSARETVASTTLQIDDFIIVIGTPNKKGGIVAKFIRIMPVHLIYNAATSTESENQ